MAGTSFRTGGGRLAGSDRRAGGPRRRAVLQRRGRSAGSQRRRAPCRRQLHARRRRGGKRVEARPERRRATVPEGQRRSPRDHRRRLGRLVPGRKDRRGGRRATLRARAHPRRLHTRQLARRRRGRGGCAGARRSEAHRRRHVHEDRRGVPSLARRGRCEQWNGAAVGPEPHGCFGCGSLRDFDRGGKRSVVRGGGVRSHARRRARRARLVPAQQRGAHELGPGTRWRRGQGPGAGRHGVRVRPHRCR
jgi:hypothetical protein